MPEATVFFTELFSFIRKLQAKLYMQKRRKQEKYEQEALANMSPLDPRSHYSTGKVSGGFKVGFRLFLRIEAWAATLSACQRYFVLGILRVFEGFLGGYIMSYVSFEESDKD